MAWPDTYTAVSSGQTAASADMNDIRQLLSGRPWFNVVGYGAILDNGTHTVSEIFGSLAAAQVRYPFLSSLSQDLNWAAFQAAESDARDAGGGEIIIPGPMKSNARFGSGGLFWCYQLMGDTIRVRGTGRYAAMNLDQSNPTALFLMGGNVKGSGLLGDASAWYENEPFGYGADQFVPAVYTPTATIAKGALSTTFSSSGIAANFSAGDWVVIRTGQTYDNSLNNNQPVAEINQCLLVSGSTVYFVYPTQHEYAQEYFISGTAGPTSTSVTANPALFGLTPIDDRIIHDIEIADLSIDMGPAGNTSHVFHGRTINELRYRHVKAVANGWGIDSVGTVRNKRVQDCRWHVRDAVAGAWHFAVDTGCTGGRASGSDFSCDGDEIVQFHVTEAAAGTVIDDNDVQMPVGTTDWPLVNIRSRAEDTTVTNNRINGTPKFNQILADGTTKGGYIHGNTHRSASLPKTAVWVRDGATGWKVGKNRTNGLGVVVANGNDLDDGRIELPIETWTIAQGTPTLVLTAGLTVWSFPGDGATHAIHRNIARLPDEWQAWDVYMDWTNLGAGSGDTGFGISQWMVDETENITSAADVATGSGLIAPPAQNIIKTSKINEVEFANTAGAAHHLRIFRDLGTPANATGIVALYAVRAA